MTIAKNPRELSSRASTVTIMPRHNRRMTTLHAIVERFKFFLKKVSNPIQVLRSVRKQREIIKHISCTISSEAKRIEGKHSITKSKKNIYVKVIIYCRNGALTLEDEGALPALPQILAGPSLTTASPSWDIVTVGVTTVFVELKYYASPYKKREIYAQRSRVLQPVH